MYQSFSIKEERLGELKNFIKITAPSVRFVGNPYKMTKLWFVAITLDVEDSDKLNELFNKWYDEDNPVKVENKSILKRFLSIFNLNL